MAETPTTDPAAPVQVVMPASLLPRLVGPLAMLGMRVYRLPTKGESTLMVAADLSELRDQAAPFTTEDVLEAWSLAVGLLAETAPKTAKTRKRKATRDAA